MKLLFWNIRHGGGPKRADQILGSILFHDPDLIIMSEFRAATEKRICQPLVTKGWKYWKSTEPTGIENGICILSRTPIQLKEFHPIPVENALRWLDIDLPEARLGLTAVHIFGSQDGPFPERSGARQRAGFGMPCLPRVRLACTTRPC